MKAVVAIFFAVLAMTQAAPSGLGLGLGLGLGVPGAVVAGPLGVAGIAPALGAGVVTRGGGVIGVSALGATVAGPRTAPVVVAGPSGTVAASGLWGPTLAGVAGHGW